MATAIPASRSRSAIGSAAVATNSTEHATWRSASTCWAIHATVESTRTRPAFWRKRSRAARPFAVLRRAARGPSRGRTHPTPRRTPPLGRRERDRHPRDLDRSPRGRAVEHRGRLLVGQPAAHADEVGRAPRRVGRPRRAVAPLLDPDAVPLQRLGEHGAGPRRGGPGAHGLVVDLGVRRAEVGQLERGVPGRRGRGDHERRLVVGPAVPGDGGPALPPLRRRAPQRVGLVGDHHVPGVAGDLVQPVPRGHDPLQAAVAQGGDGAAPVTDRDRSGSVGDDEHPLRPAQVTDRARAQHRRDRLAHAGLVGEQEHPAAGLGPRGDRVGRLELQPPGFEGVRSAGPWARGRRG